jgi:hypothetical protein
MFMAHQEMSPVIPIGSIVDHFLWSYDIAKGRSSPSPISAGENEYSSIAVVLIALGLEGYLSRVLYLLEQNDLQTEGSSIYTDMFDLAAEKKIEALKGASSDSSLVTGVDELMAVRNSLAHSHIYETERDEGRNLVATAKQQVVRTDARWKRSVDPQTFRTKVRSFNVVPSEVNYSDALTALELWGEVNSLLVGQYGAEYAYLPPHYPVHYQIDPSISVMIDKAHALNTPSLHGYVEYGRKQPIPH